MTGGATGPSTDGSGLTARGARAAGMTGAPRLRSAVARGASALTPRRPDTAARDSRDQIGRLLSGAGCPVCRFVADAQERFFAWFEIESHAEESMIARLRAAMGMCPVHSRRLLAGDVAPDLVTGVGRHVIAGARARLAGGAASGCCPGCENRDWAIRHALRLVLKGLGDPALAAAYAQSGGMCVTHLLAALAGGPSEAMAAAARLLAERLGADGDAASALALMAGEQADGEARRRLRDSLPDEEARGQSVTGTVEEMVTRLEDEACPSCQAAGQAERRYLRWLIGAQRAERSTTLELEGDDLCPDHLRDVAVLDAPAGAWAAALQARDWEVRLDELARRLEHLPAPGPLGRLRAARRSDERDPGRSRRRRAADSLRALTRPRDAARSQVEAVVRRRPCPACRARRTVDRRQTELLLAALEQAPVSARYEASHGLCVRHVLGLPAGHGADLARRVASARLGVLAWELDEALRRRDWNFRHEARGPEATGWRRVAPLVDGRILMGGAGEGEP